MSLGLDYSAGRPSGAVIKAAGYDFVIRYVDNYTGQKHITKTEYDDLLANGVRVYLVIERTVNDFQSGLWGGSTLASAARTGADKIGYPKSSPIFVTVDRHLNPGEISAAMQFTAGAVSVLGWENTGLYGFSEVINAAKAINACQYYWQCGSVKTVGSGVHFYQRNNETTVVGGVECDINDEFIRIEQGELEVPLTDEEARQIASAVWAKDIANMAPGESGTLHADVMTFDAHAAIKRVEQKLDAHIANGGGVSLDYAALAKALISEVKNG